MNAINYCNYGLGENLSEDVLSEGTPTSPVKVSKRLSHNMETTPFKICKSKKLTKDLLKSIRLLKSLKHKRKGVSYKKMYPKNKFKSFNEECDATRFERLLKKSKEDSTSHHNMSLKDGISNTLKKSEGIRKSTFALSKMYQMNSSSVSEDQESSEEERELFTFGNDS
ncbi:unnamed protein product [Moneuplotes crassus]|uniref:Uncharacterized protein n=1 Tax=Euplotes crassus TaxID=5936 RepID=A0AAD1X975_EUPCR|nr:unnamed protein product [Moneuplotes crassus]